MIRAVLFDLDGVLCDTSEFHFLAWQRLAQENGLHFTRADNEALRGVSRRESLDLLLKGRVIPEEQAEIWMERKNEYYREMLAKMTPADLLPGVDQLLDELSAAGVKIAIVSSSRNTPLVLDRLQLRPRIDHVTDGNTGLPSKPAPDLFLHAAQALNLPPADCLVVEDAAAGVAAAKAAGMRVVGLGPLERVGAADRVFPNLNGIHLDDLTHWMVESTHE